MDMELRQRSRVSAPTNQSGEVRKEKKRTSSVSRWTRVTVVAVAALFLLLVVVCPAVFWTSLTVRKSLLFMNWLNLPMFRNLSNPEMEYGLNCTRHLFIGDDNNVRIGTWHILPKSRIGECDLHEQSRLSSDTAFADDQPVVLYLHGNGGARGGNHRKSLYQVKQTTE